MLELHLKRITRDAAQQEQDGFYLGAARKWRKAKIETNIEVNRKWYAAREQFCWKMHGEQDK